MIKTSFYRVIFLTLFLGLTSGCASIVSLARDEAIEENYGTRTLGSKIDDSLIEIKASVNIDKAHAEIENRSRIKVASYNGTVLLCGQTRHAFLKNIAGRTVSKIQRVKRVSNNIEITRPSSLLTRISDIWLNTKINLHIITSFSIPLSRVKVITENHTVYIMGLVTKDEGNRITTLVKNFSGVKRIVKLFEYI